MSGYASGFKHRPCGQFVYRARQQPQRYAVAIGDYGADGGRPPAAGGAEPDRVSD